LRRDPDRARHLGLASARCWRRCARCSDGNLDIEIPHRDKRTEIGEIAETLQAFKAALIAKKTADAAGRRGSRRQAAARRNDGRRDPEFRNHGR